MRPDEADEGDDLPGCEDAVDHRVELGRVMPIEAGCDLCDQPGTGEHLVPPHQLTTRIEHLSGERVDLRAGQPQRKPRADGAGVLEGRGETLDAPPHLGELSLPVGEELIGAGVALDGAGVTGRNTAGSVAGVAGFGEVGVDVIGPLGVQVTHRLGDPGDPPVPQVPRRPRIRLDQETELDGPGCRVEPSDHGGGLDRVPERGAVEALVAALGVEHLHHVHDQHVIMWGGVTGPGRGVTSDRVGQPARGGANLGPTASAALVLEPVVEPAHGGGRLGVEDRVHRLAVPDHAEHSDPLVSAHDQLEPGTLRRHQPTTQQRVGEPSGPERRFVAGGGDLTGQAEACRTRATPPQRGLATAPVVVEGLAGVVVAAADDGRLVVRDLVDTHATEPRHQRPLTMVVLGVPQPPVAIVFLIVTGCRADLRALSRIL